jgi:hypothetical protein
MINSDDDAMNTENLVQGYGKIDVYVEHIVDEPIHDSDVCRRGIIR